MFIPQVYITEILFALSFHQVNLIAGSLLSRKSHSIALLETYNKGRDVQANLEVDLGTLGAFIPECGFG